MLRGRKPFSKVGGLVDEANWAHDFCHPYMHDILVSSIDENDHLHVLFQRLYDYGIDINTAKCVTFLAIWLTLTVFAHQPRRSKPSPTNRNRTSPRSYVSFLASSSLIGATRRTTLKQTQTPLNGLLV